MDFNERRLYQRGTHFYVVAKISRDGKSWSEVGINDISSEGLQLCTSEVYSLGEKLWFDLTIQGFFSEFETKVQGTVQRQKLFKGLHIYGIAFIELSHDIKIRIDENVRKDRPFGGDPYTID